MAASFPSVPARTNTVMDIRTESDKYESCIGRRSGALPIQSASLAKFGAGVASWAGKLNWPLLLTSKSNDTHRLGSVLISIRTFPQRLKPVGGKALTARMNPCPFKTR
jgi:hypothetical protein